MKSQYEQARLARLTAVAHQERWHARLGAVRVTLALLIPGIFWFGGWAAWPWATAALVAFVISVGIHTRIIDARDRPTACAARG